MPVTREAKYLSGADRGKHVRVMVPGGKSHDPWELAGQLGSITHWSDNTTSMTVLREDGATHVHDIPADTIVTITGRTP